MYRTAEIVSARWSLLVILSIYRGGGVRKSYSGIKEGIPGISPKMLSLRLRELESEGLITREADTRSVPFRTYYSLTGRGEGLIRIIEEIKRWGLRWGMGSTSCEGIDCRKCRKLLQNSGIR